MIALDPFYPIVDSADWVVRLLAAGARLIQLRIKDRPPEILREQISAALAACRAKDAQLVVNDYWDIAIDEGADFVHLGQGDVDGADVDRLRARGLKIGISTHDRAELDRALEFAPDYVALGPIYPTRLKPMAFAPQGLERIGEWKKLIGSRPLVAIGGITLERARLCLSAGADVVSVVTDITLNSDPDARARAWALATRSPK
jgi:thiamine-phosphate pyrophosphorylase